MTGPVSFAEVIGRLQTVAARFDCGEATRQELQDALMQLEGAKRGFSEALIASANE